ncbi:ParB N-terminal domain-containing protein [Streptomyces sp. NPDC048210]|uniref:ParB/RepB/Spo0J family partition protein n=1 Tax=unclassified Streptomyces TaxID=2593676 RepID=UPI002E774578|nr:ParB N-terminal domain-containing protein [Streptomyces sp. JV181]MEE1775630.1 ParB N-terminal domain-containing protein [Streptomyces sp. JV181]
MSEKTTAATAQIPAGLEALGRLTEFDPRTLVLDPRNARRENVKPDHALLASVERIGVQEPISVRPLEDGTFGVFKGQRRWLAATAAAKKAEAKGAPVRPIPAFVREDLTDSDTEVLLLSMVENTQRAAMTHRDQLNGVAQLELIGVSEADRRRAAGILGLKRESLRAAKQAAALTPEGLQDGARHAFDLTELADLQDVEEVSGAARRLATARKQDAEAKGKNTRGHWQHAMASLRQERDEQRMRDAAVKALTDAGVQVLPRYSRSDDTARPLDQITTRLGKEFTATTHAQCAGHAARLDEDAKPIYFCTDPEKNGHTLKDAPDAAEEAEAKEAARAERKKVIEQNKAARAAREVRTEFVAQLCKGKSLSDAAWTLVLTTVMNGSDTYRKFINRTQAKATAAVAQFTTGPTPEDNADDPFTALIQRTGKARRANLMMAQVAAAFEDEMHDKAWATKSHAQVMWLTFLEGEGYTLSTHESAILGRAAAPETAPTDPSSLTSKEEQQAPEADGPKEQAPEEDQANEADGPEEEQAEGAAGQDTPEGAQEADGEAGQGDTEPEAGEGATARQEAAQQE